MLVGGTGVTPMMGLLDKFLPLGNEACLICCNRTEDDIIYRTRLVEHVKQHPQFVLSHVIEWVPVTAMHRYASFDLLEIENSRFYGSVKLQIILSGEPCYYHFTTLPRFAIL